MIVVLILDHFGSHVLQGSTKCISLLHMITLNAPPEVTNLNNISVFDQNVFGFYVSVNQTLFVHVVDARAHLNKEIKGSILAEKLFFSYKVKEVALTGILERQINSIFILKGRIQPANILMIQLLLNPYFSYQSFFYFIRRQTGFLYLFHCYLNPSRFMPCKLYLAVAAFS